MVSEALRLSKYDHSLVHFLDKFRGRWATPRTIDYLLANDFRGRWAPPSTISFWFIFGLHLGRFFHIFSTSFSLLVYCGLTCNVCPIVLASFLGAPSPIRILLEDSYGFRTCIFLRNLLFPFGSLSKNNQA